eukprot:11029126-Prorocentrum_lima.AAC.1
MTSFSHGPGRNPDFDPSEGLDITWDHGKPILNTPQGQEDNPWKDYQKGGWQSRWVEPPSKNWKLRSQQEYGAGNPHQPKAPPSSIGMTPCEGSKRAPGSTSGASSWQVHSSQDTRTRALASKFETKARTICSNSR